MQLNPLQYKETMAQSSSPGWIWAIAAGSAAAMSAVLAKLLSPELSWFVRVLGYGGVVLLNVFMWTCYVRSLRVLCSLQATVVNFASNFLVSGLAGYIFFFEDLHIQWFLGATLIVLGILLLSQADKTKDQEKTS